MNFKAAIKTINKDYCNVAYAGYMKDEWGITVGYRIVDPYLALIRKKLADWQLLNDCNNELCKNVSKTSYTCAPGYTYGVDSNGNGYCTIGGCPPGTQPSSLLPGSCVPCISPSGCTGIIAITPDITIMSYGQVYPQGLCVLNPPLSAFGHISNWPQNVNQILINTFTI